MGKRGPNSEQLKAIEHTGGVLLSAGAGSGKTFVLVEHITYLIEKFYKDNAASIDPLMLEQELKTYLSQIVLMTFTKKAAGELNLRLIKRLEIEAQDNECPIFKVAPSAIGAMTVNTIDGFCRKILASGDVPNVNPNLDIVSDIEIKAKISKLFSDWFDSIDDERRNSALLKTLSISKNNLLQAIIEIFSSPDNRTMWRELERDKILGDEKLLLDEAMRTFGFETAIKTNVDLSEVKAGKAKETYEQFFALKAAHPLDSIESLKYYVEFWNSVSRLNKPCKNNDAVDFYHDSLKELRDFTKKYGEGIAKYSEHKFDIVMEWGLIIKEAVDYIEEHYQEVEGYNFADIEYYLLQALQDDRVAEIVRQKYKYLIVDEFQDTSMIQFEILRKIINDDYSRIFCVGDKKQAIYGFRGGEIKVFDLCASHAPQNLTMVNNYRSLGNIIDFNNSIFEHIFKLGIEFSGPDPLTVDVDLQECPIEELKNTGEIICNRYQVVFDDGAKKGKIAKDHIEKLEAERIVERIIERRKVAPDDTIAILYRKLSPANALILELIKNNLPFTSQMKVANGEDPIISMFAVMLESYMTKVSRADEEGNDDYFIYADFMFRGYFHYLQMELPNNFRCLFDKWIRNIKLFGLLESTFSFFYSLGLHNSNYAQNFVAIEKLIKIAGGDVELTYNYIEEANENSYNITFAQGSNSHLIQIMTVHASKGLQFDTVFLGGITRNGKTVNNNDYFGSDPGSFKWKENFEQKKPYDSLSFLVEKKRNQLKEYAESKRLFYVACTRAVKNIEWVEFVKEEDGELIYDNKSSWIRGIDVFRRDLAGLPIITKIQINDENASSYDTSTSKVSTPLFHMDNLGLANFATCELCPLPEVSVTGLSILATCPKRFYFKNILKLDPISEELIPQEIDNEDEIEERVLSTNLSSGGAMSRGTEVHAAIADYIVNDHYDEKYGRQIDVVKKCQKEYEDKYVTPDYVVETQIKFELMGQMVSGIPDCVVDGHKLEVWDFKTGHRHEVLEEGYWFQLRAYAYAQFVLNENLKPTTVITLKLIYVDTGEVVFKEEDYSTIVEALKKVWSRAANYDECGTDCTYCEFKNFCH